MPFSIVKDRLDVAVGGLTATITNAGLSQAADTAFVGIVSIVVGITATIATHFVKKWLNEKHPIPGHKKPGNK